MSPESWIGPVAMPRDPVVAADCDAMSMSRKVVCCGVVAALSLMAACSGDGADEGAAEDDLTPLELPAADDTAAADVAIGSVAIGELVTFAPGGWIFDASAGTFVPPADAAFDAATAWTVADRCPDPCGRRTAAEWVDVVDDVMADFAGDGELTRDEPVLSGRLIDVADGAERRVGIARWVDGEAAYVWCSLTGLAGEIDDLAVVLEFACENTKAPAV